MNDSFIFLFFYILFFVLFYLFFYSQKQMFLFSKSTNQKQTALEDIK